MKNINVTTRMEDMRVKYPELEVENGKVRLERDGRVLFELQMQNVEYLKEGYLLLKKSEEEQEIYSLTRREKIKSLSKNSVVTIITQDRHLKGFYIEDFSGKEVIDLEGRTVTQVKTGEALLQATELLGSREVYIKKVLTNGTNVFITFNGGELEVPQNVKMEFENVNGEIYVALTNNERQKWYNPSFRKVIEIQNGYKITNFVKIFKESFTDKLPFEEIEGKKVIEHDASDNEYHTKMVYYPANQEITVEEYEKLYCDANSKILYHVRPTHGRVELYRYNTGNKVTFVEKIGYTHINLLPIIEVN